MTSNTIYHYVYRITNLVEKKHYYGKRSSKCDPKEDLGKTYFSSSRDKIFQTDQKNNPQNYRYKIVRIFKNIESALYLEIKLHEKFQVGRNKSFYNIVTQKHSKFDSTNKVPCVNGLGLSILISKEDPRYISGEFYPGSKGRKQTEKSKRINSEMLTGKFGKNAKGFKQFYKTPVGIFDVTWCLEPKVNRQLLISLCRKKNKTKISRNMFSKLKHLLTFTNYEDVADKTFENIGFGIIPKDINQIENFLVP